ncbi:phosphoesterase [Halorussus gelatinilyticus]|uniref:Phosphoesterase n=1 Tax=Halorussus gelatinilyticus TaxID=2937524 RepID=A0A8U0IHS8_9EURY|nr:phosphoesterase [Halorussus gelatinilyticus]UPW00650.1 phosphoesterase [Halorussus gelatinilyticus]
MNAFDTAMELYPYVFHPGVMVGIGAVVLIHYEWAEQDADRAAFARRLGAFLAAGASSLVPTAAYVLVTGQGLYQVTKGNAWQVDALVASGVLFAAGVTWLVWHRFDWGSLVPGYMEALAAATVPYAALSPFWNFSGHVTMALVPTLYLTLVERRFWPTLAVPVVMVPNRVYLGAHDWAQSVAAFLVIAAVVAAAYWYQTGGEVRAESDSAVS